MRNQDRQRAVLVGVLVCCAVLGGMMATGLGKDVACTCPKASDCELYAALLYAPPAPNPAPVPGAAPGAQPAGAAVAQPTRIGVVRLVYDSSPPAVSLPVGSYTLDLNAVENHIRCPDCAMEPPARCEVRNLAYATVKSGAEKPVAIVDGKVTFAVTPETSVSSSTVVKVTVTYECANERCGTAKCTGDFSFGYKRANNVCQCGTYGFKLVVRNVATDKEQTVVRPEVFASLDRTGDKTIEVGEGLNLTTGSKVEISIWNLSVSCLCGLSLCPTRYPGDARAAAAAGSRHVEVKFLTKTSFCSFPTSTGWASSGLVYWGKTTLNADPKTAAVYVDFEISYGCAATEAGDCKAMTGFCNRVFRLLFVGG